MKAFIEAHYKMMDINNDGLVSIEEYRYNCITRLAVDDIKLVDDSYNSLVSVSIRDPCRVLAKRNFYLAIKRSAGVLNTTYSIGVN